MKKFIVCLAALAMLIIAPVQVSANGLEPSGGEISVAYHAYSTYTLYIPEEFDGNMCSVGITDAQLEENYQVIFTIENLNDDGYVQLTRVKGGDDQYLQLTGYSPNETWTVTNDNNILGAIRAEDVSDGQAYCSFYGTPVGEKWQPGDYSGVIIFRVECMYVRPTPVQ